MRPALLVLILSMAAGSASAQVYAPNQPYVGDPMADRLRDRMENQRLQSQQQADFARRYQLDSRLTEMDIRSRRQAEPHIPLVEVTPSPDAQRRAREAATARREAVATGVGQIDDWLTPPPR